MDPRFSLNTSNIPYPLAESTCVHANLNSSGYANPNNQFLGNRNKDLRTYADVQSKGLVSRIMKYHENGSRLQRSMSASNVYSKPGEFPVVHLKKAELPHRTAKQNLSMTRIAPPEKSVFYGNTLSSLLRSSSVIGVQKSDDEISRENRPILHPPPTENDMAPTRSVLDVLKEISRKRINSHDPEETERTKKYCNRECFDLTDVANQLQQSKSPLLTPNNKRQRDQIILPTQHLLTNNLSPTSINYQQPVQNSPEQVAKKRLCTYNNDITSSLSSSQTNNKRKLFSQSQNDLTTISKNGPSCDYVGKRTKLHQQQDLRFEHLSKTLSCNTPITPIPTTPYNETLNNHVQPSKSNIESGPPQRAISSLQPFIQNSDYKRKEILPQNKEITLFNKKYDASQRNVENPVKTKPYDEDEDWSATDSISFVKPKAVTIIGKRSKMIEDAKKSRLSKMLQGLRGEIYISDDEEEDVVDAQNDQDSEKDTAQTVSTDDSTANSKMAFAVPTVKAIVSMTTNTLNTGSDTIKISNQMPKDVNAITSQVQPKLTADNFTKSSETISTGVPETKTTTTTTTATTTPAFGSIATIPMKFGATTGTTPLNFGTTTTAETTETATTIIATTTTTTPPFGSLSTSSSSSNLISFTPISKSSPTALIQPNQSISQQPQQSIPTPPQLGTSTDTASSKSYVGGFKFTPPSSSLAPTTATSNVKSPLVGIKLSPQPSTTNVANSDSVKSTPSFEVPKFGGFSASSANSPFSQSQMLPATQAPLQFGTVSTDSTPVVNPPSYSFGNNLAGANPTTNITTTTNTTTSAAGFKPQFSFGGYNTTITTTSAPTSATTTFSSFGATNSAAPTPFSFGAVASTPAAVSSTTSTTTTSNNSMLSFGQVATAAKSTISVPTFGNSTGSLAAVGDTKSFNFVGSNAAAVGSTGINQTTAAAPATFGSFSNASAQQNNMFSFSAAAQPGSGLGATSKNAFSFGGAKMPVSTTASTSNANTFSFSNATTNANAVIKPNFDFSSGTAGKDARFGASNENLTKTGSNAASSANVNSIFGSSNANASNGVNVNANSNATPIFGGLAANANERSTTSLFGGSNGGLNNVATDNANKSPATFAFGSNKIATNNTNIFGQSGATTGEVKTIFAFGSGGSGAENTNKPASTGGFAFSSPVSSAKPLFGGQVTSPNNTGIVKPTFSFGSTGANNSNTMKSPFGGNVNNSNTFNPIANTNNANEMNDNNKAFNFGANTNHMATSSSQNMFGGAPNTNIQTQSGGFAFNAANTEQQKPTGTNSFSFGGATGNTTGTTSFNFNGSIANANSTVNADAQNTANANRPFSFGSRMSSTNLGSVNSASSPTNLFGSTSAGPTNTFNFGSNATTNQQQMGTQNNANIFAPIPGPAGGSNDRPIRRATRRLQK